MQHMNVLKKNMMTTLLDCTYADKAFQATVIEERNKFTTHPIAYFCCICPKQLAPKCEIGIQSIVKTLLKEYCNK